MMGLPLLPSTFVGRRSMLLEDNFAYYSSGTTWTSVVNNSGTVATGNFSPSGILFTTGGADNNYTYTYATNKNFIYIADKPIVFETIFKYSEVATTGTNIGFGFSDSVVAGSLVDNGGGPAASFSGAMIYKVDGGSAWKVVSSIGTAQTISTVANITPGGTNLVRARIEIRYVNGDAEVSYWMQNVGLLGSNTAGITGGQLLDSTTLKPIKHTVTAANIASAAQMTPFFGIKAGTAAAYTAYCHRIAAAMAY